MPHESADLLNRPRSFVLNHHAKPSRAGIAARAAVNVRDEVVLGLLGVGRRFEELLRAGGGAEGALLAKRGPIGHCGSLHSRSAALQVTRGFDCKSWPGGWQVRQRSGPS